ncbi:MAG: uroporphyrinogen decarboxylase family protein [Lachnospiraceae bacterium]|nr:uroporphyrinogen decarboxylase family protein [Lachnospiraceae bacterium]
MKLIELEMTPKERRAAYHRGEEVDRIPTTLSASETAPPLYGYKMHDYYFNADVMVDVESHLAEDFHADNMGIGLGLRTVVEALGTKIAVPENSVSYIEKPRINSFEQIAELSIPDIHKDGRLPIIVEAMKRLQDKYGETRGLGSGLAGPFTTAAGLIGTENFLMGMIRDKKGAHALLQFTTDVVVEVSKALHQELGIGLMLSEPMGSANLISKSQFKKFFAPYLKQAVERMNRFQGGTGIHICGNTKDRWEDVVNAGISNFWVDNCESLKELKELYGQRIGVTGNIPPVDVLWLGTPDDIDRSIKESLLAAADNPMGFTLSPGCTTPMGTSKENMTAFMNAAATYGKGAKKGQMPKGLIEFM